MNPRKVLKEALSFAEVGFSGETILSSTRAIEESPSTCDHDIPVGLGACLDALLCEKSIYEQIKSIKHSLRSR